MKDIPQIVRLHLRRPNETFALATLIATTGSSYRRPGARMLIARDGARAGSLSAGCLEDEVAQAAHDVIATGKPQVMPFDTRRRFGCNGSINILVERADNGMLRELACRVAARASFRLATTQAGTHLIEDNAYVSPDAFVQQVDPTVRLLAIGLGPDVVALCQQAELLAWEAETFESIVEWRGAFDAWTAAVIATHNYGRDCAALRHLLPLGLRYIGVVGPRRRRDELLADVLDSGAEMRSQLFAPAGLHLAGETPPEIALSIVAEIQMTFAGATAVPLSQRRAPIHEPLVAETAS